MSGATVKELRCEAWERRQPQHRSPPHLHEARGTEVYDLGAGRLQPLDGQGNVALVNLPPSDLHLVMAAAKRACQITFDETKTRKEVRSVGQT